MAKMLRQCVQCSGAFEPVKHNQITCSRECGRLRKNEWQYARNHETRIPKAYEKTCVICGKRYVATWPHQKRCEADACRKKLRSEYQMRYYAAKAVDPGYMEKKREYERKMGRKYYWANREKRLAQKNRPDVKARYKAQKAAKYAEERAIIKAFRELQLSVQGE